MIAWGPPSRQARWSPHFGFHSPSFLLPSLLRISLFPAVNHPSLSLGQTACWLGQVSVNVMRKWADFSINGWFSNDFWETFRPNRIMQNKWPLFEFTSFLRYSYWMWVPPISEICHISVINLSQNCHLHKTVLYLSQICHNYVINLSFSYISHKSVIWESQICHKCVSFYKCVIKLSSLFS